MSAVARISIRSGKDNCKRLKWNEKVLKMMEVAWMRKERIFIRDRNGNKNVLCNINDLKTN